MSISISESFFVETFKTNDNNNWNTVTNFQKTVSNHLISLFRFLEIKGSSIPRFLLNLENQITHKCLRLFTMKILRKTKICCWERIFISPSQFCLSFIIRFLSNFELKIKDLNFFSITVSIFSVVLKEKYLLSLNFWCLIQVPSIDCQFICHHLKGSDVFFIIGSNHQLNKYLYEMVNE